MGELADAGVSLLGCRDYARVDFRVKPSGEPYLLEVNPNPDFSPWAGFAGGLAAQLEHKDFIVRVIEQALSRQHTPRPSFTPAV